MKSWVKSFLFLSCLLPLMALAQISPLPVDQNTVGLWNFDTDIGDQVIDAGTNPVNGMAYTTEHIAIPNINPVFNLARRFSAESSFVDLGVVQGSKLNFADRDELSIEAVIHLVSSASGDHIIFSSENVRLMVVNNQLAAFIRQPGGLFGVVSDRTLSLNTTYRVGLHYKEQDLLLSINGRVDSRIRMDFGIQNPQFSTSRASIGGDIFARYFPGYIDDIRVRNVVGIDIQGPGIELVEPASFQVTVPKPNFLINLSDDLSGVDVSSIEVYLNGILQPGILRTATEISGQLNDSFSSTVLNEVKIVVSDNQGNVNEKNFFFSYASIFQRQEYTADEHTLALWHMNDYSPAFMKDDSGNGRNGFGNVTQVQTADGVFGLGRQFSSGDGINFDSIRFNNLKFTLEGWFRPTVNNSSEEILFYNGQVKIIRWNGGYIRVILFTTRGELNYQSNDILLPVNELHHLAVSWDGTKPSQNITFYLDGMIRGQLDTIKECDFDHIPKLGIIGQNYEGLMDEMRFSSIPRTVFSVPVVDNQVITYLTLKNGTSVNEAFPEFHATINSATSIEVGTVKISLNGVLEPASSNLVITSTGIDGKFANPLQVGLNHLEVAFLDNQGNQRKKSQYFYYIKKDGGAEYDPSVDTAGLWHFNESVTGRFEDSTNNGNDFVTENLTPVEGVIGNGVQGEASFSNRIPLNCRAFTVETYVKVNEAYPSFIPLYSLGSSTSSQTLRFNPSNGNIQVYIYNTSSLDVEVPQAIPVDNAYHHVALVYDGSRSYSQLLLIVDGVIKRSFDYHNTCDFSGNNTFQIGYSNILSYDEMRVSKSAKYSFNLQNEVSDRPALISINASNKSTVYSSSFELNFSVNDVNGINSLNTKVFVNGNEQQVSQTNNKLVSDFTSTLALQNGANFITIKTQDMKGNDQVFNQILYMFAKAPSAEYSPDAATVFLYHMNEETGDFVDSASSGVSILEGGWTRSAGVFAGAANNYSIGGSYSYEGVNATNGWTFEFWRKGGTYQDLNIFNGGNLQVNTSNWGLSVYFNGHTFTQTENIMNDDEYHHYAVVFDPSHELANVYLLVDGNVVYSSKTNASMELSIENLTGAVGHTMYGGDLDEVRFSRVPRYEMVSSQQ